MSDATPDAPRPDPVEGTAFESSPRKAVSGVLGGLFLTFIAVVAIVWRLGYFTLDNRRPGLLLTVAAAVIAIVGPALTILSLVQMFRKRRVVLGADRLQVVQRRGGEDVVLAQVMYANVAGLVMVKTEAGRTARVKLADRAAAGTFDAMGAVRPAERGAGFDLVIDDQYQGKLEGLIEALDGAVMAWRAEQPDDEPGTPPAGAGRFSRGAEAPAPDSPAPRPPGGAE